MLNCINVKILDVTSLLNLFVTNVPPKCHSEMSLSPVPVGNSRIRRWGRASVAQRPPLLLGLRRAPQPTWCPAGWDAGAGMSLALAFVWDRGQHVRIFWSRISTARRDAPREPQGQTEMRNKTIAMSGPSSHLINSSPKCKLCTGAISYNIKRSNVFFTRHIKYWETLTVTKISERLRSECYS